MIVQFTCTTVGVYRTVQYLAANSLPSMATMLLLLRSNTLKRNAALIPLISTMWLPDRES